MSLRKGPRLMRYQSTNELDTFIKAMELTDQRMTWFVSDANVAVQNTQNPSDKVLSVSDAVLIFDAFSIENIHLEACSIYRSDAHQIESRKATDIQKNQWSAFLLESFQNDLRIQNMKAYLKLEGSRYHASFMLDNGAGGYTFAFNFATAVVEWNSYNGEAWYEHPKWYRD